MRGEVRNFLTGLSLILSIDKTCTAVNLAKLWLFDLAGWVAGNICKDDLLRSLVTGQTLTEFIDFLFGAGVIFLDLNNSGCDFTETLVRQADNRNVLDGGMCTEEVLVDRVLRSQ